MMRRTTGHSEPPKQCSPISSSMMEKLFASISEGLMVSPPLSGANALLLRCPSSSLHRLADALPDDLPKLGVGAKGLAHGQLEPGMAQGGLLHLGGEILQNMGPCKEKVRIKEDAPGPAGDAGIDPFLDIGGVLFAETYFHEVVAVLPPHHVGDGVQNVVGLGDTRAVADEKNGCFHALLLLLRMKQFNFRCIRKKPFFTTKAPSAPRKSTRYLGALVFWW
jgi:hypothetical protein